MSGLRCYYSPKCEIKADALYFCNICKGRVHGEKCCQSYDKSTGTGTCLRCVNGSNQLENHVRTGLDISVGQVLTDNRSTTPTINSKDQHVIKKTTTSSTSPPLQKNATTNSSTDITSNHQNVTGTTVTVRPTPT